MRRAREFILAEALKKQGSVRRIKRVLNKLLEEPIGNELIKREIRLGDLVEVTYEGGEELSFYLSEGAAAVADADRIVVAGEGANSGSLAGLAFQRKLDRATRKAARARTSPYEIKLTLESFDEMAEEQASLIHDLIKVFGVKMVATRNTWQAPFTVAVVVRAIPEQIELIRSKYPEATFTELPGESEDKQAS